MAKPKLKEQFDDLTVSEQISLVQELWDRIAADPSQVPVPPSHLDELKRRVAEHDAAPDDLVDWEDLKAELRQPR